MSFLASLKTVSLYDNDLPKINANDKQKYPKKTQVVNLIGGVGGDIGEKSYKPVVEFYEGLGTENSVLDIQNDSISKFLTTEINSENDCGHAIKIIQDSSNKSQVNIGYINPTSGINIYSSSEDLKFANLYSGVATTATSYSNGNTVLDFIVRTNGTEQIQTILDTENGLNKYYFDMSGGSVGLDTCSKFLTKNVTSATDATSLLNVFVSEIDMNNTYVSYIDDGFISKNVTSGSITITIEAAKAFLNGDEIIIGDINNDNNYIFGIVTSYNIGTGILTFTFAGASPNRVDLFVGSFVTIYRAYLWFVSNAETLSHCISTTWSASSSPSYSDLREAYTAANAFGFRFKYKRSKTNNNILDYKNQFTWFKNSYVKTFNDSPTFSDFQRFIQSGGASGDPEFKFDRIGNRSFLKNQYSGLPDFIRKNKFSILFNGFYPYNNTFKYFHGYYRSIFNMTRLHSTMLTDPKNYLVTVGSGAFKDNNLNFKPYFSHKLYEVLSYRNLQDLNTGNPQRIIVDYLISKYKEKAFFGSSEIQNNKDIYYSQVDRPNIFGKINKFVI